MNLGIYIQVPFCQTKCTYCNFHTGVVSPARFSPYASAVQTEIREHQRRLRKADVVLPDSFALREVDTVYFGGGTPSLLDPAHLTTILNAIRDTFATDFSEVTLEADFIKLKGTQDPTVNNGATVRKVTLKDRDGIVLMRVKPVKRPAPPASVTTTASN